jgi:RNA polymerase sigma-70 factor (ECF subfamily)
MSERVLHIRHGGYRQLSDAELVRSVGRGESEAMRELFERHHERVHRILARLRSVDASDVDDLVQSTFLEVQRSAARYGEQAAVGTWIVAIAVNVARHYTRREIRRKMALADLSIRMPFVADAESPLDESSNRQAIKRLARAFDQLSRDHKEIFLLCDVEGLRGTEVAHALKLPEGTVWRRLHEARMTLRQQMSDKESP